VGFTSHSRLSRIRERIRVLLRIGGVIGYAPETTIDDLEPADSVQVSGGPSIVGFS